MNIRPITKTIHSIFDGSCADVYCEPENEVTENFLVVGTVENPIAKRFWNFSLNCSNIITKMIKDHDVTHEIGTCNDTSCNTFVQNIIRLTEEREIYKKFFWEFVFLQFPEIQKHEHINVNKNWIISVSKNDLVDTDSILFNKDNPSSRFIEFVNKICNGTSDFRFNINFLPVGKDEKMIGIIQNNLVMQILNLKEGYCTPSWMGLPRFRDYESFIKWLKPKTFVEAAEFQLKLKRINYQIDLLEKWFWLAVKDLIPESENHCYVGIRKNWYVVSINKNIEDQEIDKLLDLDDEFM